MGQEQRRRPGGGGGGGGGGRHAHRPWSCRRDGRTRGGAGGGAGRSSIASPPPPSILHGEGASVARRRRRRSRHGPPVYILRCIRHASPSKDGPRTMATRPSSVEGVPDILPGRLVVVATGASAAVAAVAAAATCTAISTSCLFFSRPQSRGGIAVGVVKERGDQGSERRRSKVVQDMNASAVILPTPDMHMAGCC